MAWGILSMGVVVPPVEEVAHLRDSCLSKCEAQPWPSPTAQGWPLPSPALPSPRWQPAPEGPPRPFGFDSGSFRAAAKVRILGAEKACLWFAQPCKKHKPQREPK